MPTQWVTRSGTKLFRFKAPDGSAITDSTAIGYYKSLGIPPAWQQVRIAVSRRAKVLATGIDSAGRTQYVYHPAYREQQEKTKFERILQFAEALPNMRKSVDADLQRSKLDYRKVMAVIVSIMDRTYIRIGNDTYAKQNNSYGLTTLRSKHTTVQGDTITFDFMGKSGKHHVQKITERSLAQVVRQLDNLPGYEVFKYYDDDGKLTDVKSSDVNAYIKDIMGDEFSAKDFRTWAGTLLATTELATAARALSGEGVVATPTGRKQAVTACVKKVARKLGNTPAIARSSYIDPRVIEMFMDGDDLSKVFETVRTMKQKKGAQYMSPEERCVLVVLGG